MKKIFTQFTFVTLLSILFSLLSTPAKSSHMMGSDITWKCLGKDTYQITITVYRDCNGIPIGASPLNVTSACGNINLSTSPVDGVDITPVCKKSCTRCPSSGGGRGCSFPYGIERYTFTATLYLTAAQFRNCCDFQLVWGQCCRNGAITTAQPGNFTVTAQLNRCTDDCNSSPQFANPPIAMFCVGQCINMNPGAFDDDEGDFGADSLSYRMVEPLATVGQTIPYNAPYRYYEPLRYDGGMGDTTSEWDPPKTCKGFRLDPQTGDVQFKATRPDQTIFAFAVTEWRKDANGVYKKIGEIRRDLQIIIIECEDNNAPILSGIDGTNQTSINFCANQSKCFTVNSFDPDRLDTVTMDWNRTLASRGATFEVEKGKKWPKGKFCWTPTNADVRSYPYSFVIEAVDDACPIPGRTSRSFQVYVNKAPEASYTAKIGTCGNVTFSAFNTGETPIVRYTWSGDGRLRGNSANHTHKYKYSGKMYYSLTLRSDRGCETTYIDSLEIPPYVNVELPNDSVVCPGEVVTIPTTRQFGTAPFVYEWFDNLGTFKANDFNRTFTVTQDTTIWVKIIDLNGQGCINSDTMTIKLSKLSDIDLGADRRGCSGVPIVIKGEDAVDPPIIKAKYAWSRINSSGVKQPLYERDSLSALDEGVYILDAIDSIGCIVSDTIELFFNPEVRVDKVNMEVCRNDSIRVSAGVGQTGTTWRWFDIIRTNPDGSPRPVPELTGSTELFIPRATAFEYRYLVTASQTLNGVTCEDRDTIRIKVNELPTFQLENIPDQCIDNTPLNLNIFTNKTGGVWSFPSNPSAVANNTLYQRNIGIGVHFLTYTLTDPVTGCKKSDSIDVFVDETPNVFAGDDSFICIEDGVQPLNGLPDRGIWEGPGVTGDPVTRVYTFSPQAAGPGNHTLKYTFSNTTGARCDDEDEVRLTVYATLEPNAGQDRELCVNSAAIQLNGNTVGQERTWFSTNAPAGSVVNTGGNNYRFDPTVAGVGTYTLVYQVAYTGNICPKYDTMQITVNPLPLVGITTFNGQTRFCQDFGQVELIPDVNPTGGNIQITSTTPGVIISNKFFETRNATIGDNIVIIRYADPKGCVNTDTMVITVDGVNKADILTNRDFCVDEVIEIQGAAENGDIYEWTSNFGVSGFTNPNDLTTGVILNADGLAGGFSVNLRVSKAGSTCPPDVTTREFVTRPLPVVEFFSDKINGCGPLTVNFTDASTIDVNRSQIARWIWEFSDGTRIESGANVTHTFRTPGKYSVLLTVISDYGCESQLLKTDMIEVFKTPTASFVSTPSFTTITSPTIEFTNTTDSTEPGVRFVWNYGDSILNPDAQSFDKDTRYTYSDTGIYKVRLIAINPNGCLDTSEGLVNIRPDIIVYIPNSFTPNDLNIRKTEGRNEKFWVVASYFSTFDISIFNRWGELMYKSEDINEGWDGKWKGIDAAESVYVYVVNIKSLDGREYRFTGNITLIR